MNNYLLIDDKDRNVRYSQSPDWDLDHLAPAVGGTRHGAARTGQTVALSFYGECESVHVVQE